MKSNSIANENVPHFYVRLKHRKMEKWYVNEMQAGKSQRKAFNHSDEKAKFEIDQIGFYQKHLWFHFESESDAGWIPNKFIRKNYRILNLQASKDNTEASNEEKALSVLVHFSRPDFDVYDKLGKITDNLSDATFKSILVKSVGSYKDLTKKSYRRVRSQINRNRPVMLWGRRDNQCIVLFGFNHRVFFYFDPEDGLNKIITVKELTKLWKRSGYKAISY